ncbi:hypothetical protein [Flavobacterium sp.]|uniref:hypothetical protein n=1 Tax=Flavobacterium sp. TaxID=239 RepID=UPI0031E3F6F4
MMNTKGLSEETEKRLLDFFTDVIDPKDMAKALRTTNYLLTLSVIRERDEMGKINLENFFYWVNELAEVLDPYLEVE